jgi:hypothetical protein
MKTKERLTMELDLDAVRRTVWRVEDPVWYFQKMRPLLTTIDDLEDREIEAQLKEDDFGYVEIATRLPHSESEDPDAILVFEDDQVRRLDLTNSGDAVRQFRIACE